MLTEPYEVADALTAILEKGATALGISFLDYGEENVLIPAYPAVIVTPGPVERELATTHQFTVTLHAEVWVHHGDLTATRKERTRADLQLASAIKNLFHKDSNITLGGEVIFGFVSDSRGGITVVGKSKSVITTRMSYIATSRELWK